jgi:hypothetical protein
MVLASDASGCFDRAMSESKKPRPRTGAKAEQAASERVAREAAALRENLRRRKAQARQREDGVAPEDAAEPREVR